MSDDQGTPTKAPAARPGWRTSEFWMSLMGIVATAVVPVADQAVGSTMSSVASHNASNAWGALAPVLIAAVYTAGRSYVKAQAPAQQTPPTA